MEKYSFETEHGLTVTVSDSSGTIIFIAGGLVCGFLLKTLKLTKYSSKRFGLSGQMLMNRHVDDVNITLTIGIDNLLKLSEVTGIEIIDGGEIGD